MIQKLNHLWEHCLKPHVSKARWSHIRDTFCVQRTPHNSDSETCQNHDPEVLQRDQKALPWLCFSLWTQSHFECNSNAEQNLKNLISYYKGRFEEQMVVLLIAKMKNRPAFRRQFQNSKKFSDYVLKFFTWPVVEAGWTRSAQIRNKNCAYPCRLIRARLNLNWGPLKRVESFRVCCWDHERLLRSLQMITKNREISWKIGQLWNALEINPINQQSWDFDTN